MRRPNPKYKKVGPPRPVYPYRIVTKFLLKPLTINEEERWLETASWHEVWHEWLHVSWWEKLHWVDDPRKVEHWKEIVKREGL